MKLIDLHNKRRLNQYRKPVVGGGGSEPPVGYDADAQNFIDAVSTLTTAEEVAIDDLVVGLKANGTWGKYKAIYPFIGGTASSHKWNLKDPFDLDVSFRLTFNGTVTHDANGITGDGSTGYINTHALASDIWTENSIGFSLYSRTDIQASDLFGFVDSSGFRARIRIRYSGDVYYSDVVDATNGRITSSNTSSNAYFNISKIANNDHRFYKNGVQLGATGTGVPTGFATTTEPFYFLALNSSGTVTGFSNKNLAFATLSDGLTSTEVLNDTVLVEQYQQALSRGLLTNLIPNGDFSNGTTGWDSPRTASTVSEVNGWGRSTIVISNSAGIRTDVLTLVVGQDYVLSFDYDNTNTTATYGIRTSPNSNLGGEAYNDLGTISSGASGKIAVSFTAVAVSNYLGIIHFGGQTIGEYLEVDNFVLYAV